MNGSTAQDADDGYGFVWIYLIWISYFFLVALTNLLVTITIFRYRALRERKEYVMMSGLCFADFLDISSGYALIAVYRLTLIYEGQWSSKRSDWECVILPHNLIHWCAKPSAVLMLVLLSFDRLICVSRPLKYFHLTSKYAYRLVGSLFMFCILLGMLVVVLGSQHRNEVSLKLAAGCFTSAVVLQATNDGYALYFLYIQPVGASVSVVLYLCVGVVYWKKKNRAIGNSTTIQEHSKQQRLTKSLAISCVCTTVFVVIPIALANTGELLSASRIFHQTMWLLPPMNAFCNVIIYIKRQDDIRKGIVAMLRNKEMPPTVNLWNSFQA